ncbi:MAG: hypothetical protein LC808_38990 [Actinobacteria bacterium]|nr:hypothetical protein [Actinomycetota bacterium]
MSTERIVIASTGGWGSVSTRYDARLGGFETGRIAAFPKQFIASSADAASKGNRKADSQRDRLTG